MMQLTTLIAPPIKASKIDGIIFTHLLYNNNSYVTYYDILSL